MSVVYLPCHFFFRLSLASYTCRKLFPFLLNILIMASVGSMKYSLHSPVTVFKGLDCKLFSMIRCSFSNIASTACPYFCVVS